MKKIDVVAEQDEDCRRVLRLALADKTPMKAVAILLIHQEDMQKIRSNCTIEQACTLATFMQADNLAFFSDMYHSPDDEPEGGPDGE